MASTLVLVALFCVNLCDWCWPLPVLLGETQHYPTIQRPVRVGI